MNRPSALAASVTGKGPQPVYVVDFAVYKPPEECGLGTYEAWEYNRTAEVVEADTADFMLRVAEKSGKSLHVCTYAVINPSVC